MSTVFDFRNLRLPKLSRAAVIVGALAVVLAIVLAFAGFQLFKKLTNNTVVAYFPAANALYSGDKVEIMGVKVGAVDKVEPAGDKMKVTLHYSNTAALEIETGQLVRILDEDVRSGLSYWLVTMDADFQSRDVKAFRQWLLDELGGARDGKKPHTRRKLAQSTT